MRNLRRAVLGLFVALIGLSTAGAGGAPVRASGLASPTIYIDDASDGVQCKNSTSTTDLSTLVLASNQTITLCSGEYLGPLSINGLSHVRITGKADKDLGSPRVIPPLGYDGPVIDVVDSDDVTIDGLVIDGADSAGRLNFSGTGVNIAGISVKRSSATIKDNVIIRMRRESLSSVKTGWGVHVTADAATAATSVKIQDNTIFDSQYAGIGIDDTSDDFGVTATISGNLVTTTAAGGSNRVGIVMFQTDAGTISNNTVTGDWSMNSGTTSPFGIALIETQHVKVSGNEVSGNYYGIFGTTHHAIQDLVGNTISSNTVENALYGIYMSAQLDATSTGPLAISDNKVSSNKIVTNALNTNAYGLIFSDSVSAVGTISYSGNSLTSNTINGYGHNSSIMTVDTDPAHFKISGNKIGFITPGN